MRNGGEADGHPFSPSTERAQPLFLSCVAVISGRPGSNRVHQACVTVLSMWLME